MPEPTKTPSQPSFIIKATSTGVATLPATKFTTGNDLFGKGKNFIDIQSLKLTYVTQNRPHVSYYLNNITSTDFSFSPDHSSSFNNPSQCLTKVLATTDKRHTKIMFVDMVHFICNSDHFTFINVINTDGL
jgi:hypothetical protein